MVFTELEEVSEYWDRSWDFWDSLDVSNICAIRPLCIKLAMPGDGTSSICSPNR
jgi:hypothetical protein